MKTRIQNVFVTLALFAGIGRVAAQSFGIIYNFTNGIDGAYPFDRLVLSSNTLYGTTAMFFAPNYEYGTPGTVFKVNTDGSGFTPLHNFSPVGANSDGAAPQAGLVLSNNILYGTAEQGGTNGTGAIFKLNSDGTGFTAFHDFAAYNANATGIATNGEGYGPYDRLALSGTTLYGTANSGGTNGFGTVFAIDTDGTGFRVLHHFTGSPSDGGHPYAGLVLAGNTLYGTSSGEADNGSGSQDAGTVFAINTDGTGFMLLHSFTYAGGVAPSTGNSDGASPFGGLILSGNTLYGTTEAGGTNGYGTVFAVQTNGMGFVSLHTFSGGSDGATPTDTLILSGNTLYGTTSHGGSSSGYGYGGGGTVFAVNINGSGFTTLHTFAGSPYDGSVPQDGLLLSSNTLYGTTIIGGSSNYGTIFGLSASSQAPSITQQPSDLTVIAGSSASFNVEAIGTPPLSYQWRLNGTNLATATNSSYTLQYALTTNLTGLPSSYNVVVSNFFGAVTSQVAVLTVDIPVGIYVQPQSQIVLPGTNVNFSVIPVGTPPFGYQWYYDGISLGTNATGTNYTVANAQFASSGSYYVVITNPVGSITSSVAVLMVRDYTQPAIQVPSNVVVGCTGPGGAVATFNVTASDIYDPSPSVTCTPPSGSMFPIGFTSVMCVATDHFGNTNQQMFPVHVTGQCDGGCIALNTPSTITVSLGQAPTVPVRFSPTASNTCTGQPYPVQCTPHSGSFFPPGTNIVMCVASRGGATVTNTFAVIVNVTNGPTIQAPSSIVTTANTIVGGQNGANVYFNVSALVPYNINRFPVNLNVVPPPCSFLPVGTNTVTSTATDSFHNITTNVFSVVVNPPPATPHGIGPCDPNWGFEDTNGFGCWTVTYAQPGCTPLQPVMGDLLRVSQIAPLQQQMQTSIGGDYWNNLLYSVGQKGQGWLCTGYHPPGCGCDPYPPQPDNSVEATLFSASFPIKTKYITFLLGGNTNDPNLQVQLWVQLSPGAAYQEEAHTNATGFELMSRQWWDVSQWNGLNAQIIIVDNSATGHLNVDDFQFTDTAPINQAVTLGANTYPAVVMGPGGYYYDWDSPVWGFTDMHAHPMSCLGFGQMLLHGEPDGAVFGTQNPTDPSVALQNCTQDGPAVAIMSDHGGIGCDDGDPWRTEFVTMTDPAGNSPHGEGWDPNPTNAFRMWPVFSSLSHQQMWYEWIQRAYNGGQRVMVALTDNNELLSVASKGNYDAPQFDLEVCDLEIQSLKLFVSRHSNFMAIAYDPYQLRSIVRSNLMTIVIGTESDDIGNLMHDANVDANDVNQAGQPLSYSQLQVTNAIWHLYTNGVRYVFTVHLADNKFGGTQVSDPLLDVGSRFLNSFGPNPHGEMPAAASPADNIQFVLPCMNLTDPSGMCLSQKLNIPLSVSSNIASDLNGSATLGQDGTVALQAVNSLWPGNGFFIGLGEGACSIFSVIDQKKYSTQNLINGAESHLLQAALTYGFPLDPPGGIGTFGEPCIVYPTSFPNWSGVAGSNVCMMMNANLLPIYNNYPDWVASTTGVTNQMGLAPLGCFAVKQMMSLGIMLDIDHMSQFTVDGVFNIATNAPGGGYPLNSGHNGYRSVGLHNSENTKSDSQLATIQQLGGLLGVGWAGGPGFEASNFSAVVRTQQYSTSTVSNDCAGTSKTWAQEYLYALEMSHGSNVTFGTDASGFVVFAGPRFGPQSASGLSSYSPSFPGDLGRRGLQILWQSNGVAYTSNALLTTAAFEGPATDYTYDPMNNNNLNEYTGYTGLWNNYDQLNALFTPILYDSKLQTQNGYIFNGEQADFFPAINIYYYFLNQLQTPSNPNGTITESVLENTILPNLENSLSPDYENTSIGSGLGAAELAFCDNSRRMRIIQFASGLLKGPFNDTNASGFACPSWALPAQQLAIGVYQTMVLQEPEQTALNQLNDAGSILGGIIGQQNDGDFDPAWNIGPSGTQPGQSELEMLTNVWAAYQQVFGNNTPMTRCKTAGKEWDINFEGVAHYGLFPDFLQDLKNVGLQTHDMNPIFHSAEGFATMWTKCIKASAAFGAIPQIYTETRPDAQHIRFSFTHGYHAYAVQENDDLNNPSGWHPANISELETNPVTATVTIPLDSCANCARYFRVSLSP
jgi:uncharacterized repeat protein (TIGR03803 family)